MYIIYLLIIILLVLLFIIIKDKISILKIISIITMSSGILITILGYTLKILIKTSIYYINLSKATSIIVNNFLIISLIFIISGIISYIMYKILKPKNNTKSITK